MCGVSITIIVSLANNNRPNNWRLGERVSVRDNPFIHKKAKNMQSKCSRNKSKHKLETPLCWSNFQGNMIFYLNNIMSAKQNILHVSMFAIMWVRTCTAYRALSYFYSSFDFWIGRQFLSKVECVWPSSSYFLWKVNYFCYMLMKIINGRKEEKVLPKSNEDRICIEGCGHHKDSFWLFTVFYWLFWSLCWKNAGLWRLQKWRIKKFRYPCFNDTRRKIPKKKVWFIDSLLDPALKTL